MIGKRGANPPLPRNCKRRGPAIRHWRKIPGRRPEPMRREVRRPVPLETSEGKTMFLGSRRFSGSISLLLVFTGIAFSLPEVTIHGTVSDPTGAAVTKARVELIENDRVAITVMTDLRGRYAIHRELTARSRLRVSSPGFGTVENALSMQGESKDLTANISLPLAS